MGKDTKELLKDSLVELAKGKPLDKITIKEISEHAGVTSQTFYNHFRDKYDMVHWAFTKRVDFIFENYKNGVYGWNGLLNDLLVGYKKNSKFIVNAFKNTSGNDSYTKKTGRYVCYRMEEEIKRKTGDSKVKQELSMLIKMYASGLINMIAYWLAEEPDIQQENVAQYMEDAMPEKLKNIFY